MTVHTMKLNHTPFARIANGSKTVEMRLNDEKRRRIAVGDRIRFTRADGEATLTCRVVALHPYPTFADLYGAFSMTAIGYSPEEALTASPADMDVYYPREEQEKYGVLGIELQIIEQ